MTPEGVTINVWVPGTSGYMFLALVPGWAVLAGGVNRVVGHGNTFLQKYSDIYLIPPKVW
jgi:hypothetical protein